MIKKIIRLFCIIGAICIYWNAIALPDCDKSETECLNTPGCRWSADSCNYCSGNDYYDGATKTCKNCPTSHPNSAVGSVNGISDCYKPCETETINGGKRVPSSDKAYHNTQCTYTTQCDNDGGDCNLGFHPNGDNCVSNVTSCDNNGFKFYNETGFSNCFVPASSCGSNETLIGRGYACNSATYGECMTNAIPCNTAPGLTTSACSGGTITGNATLNGGTYNLSQCACEKTSVPITNGNAGEKCFYNASTNRFEVNCTNSVNSCDAGYCSTNGQSCVAVSPNYFSGVGDKDCYACPAGAKSAAGSTSISACHYDTSTRFTDSMVEFTIPASNITIEWKK